MTLVLTKTPADVFAATDGIGAPRGADMGECEVLLTEVVAGIDEVAAAVDALTTGDQAPLFGDSALPLLNGKIVESHTGGAVTFAVKTLAGLDPSDLDPVHVPFIRADGTVEKVAISAPLSQSISYTSTLGQSSGLPFQLIVAALDFGGTIELVIGARNSPTTADKNAISGLYLDESKLYPTTYSETAGSNVAGVFYGYASRTNRAIRALARVDYDSGLATAGDWSSSPDRIVMCVPHLVKAGLNAAFFAHRNNVSQTGASHLAYTKVAFGTRRIDIGDCWDEVNSRWYPPPGLVRLSAMAWAQANHAQTTNAGTPQASANFVAKIIKNGGIDIAAGTGYSPAGFPETAGAAVPMAMDIAQEGDYYELYCYTTSVDAIDNVVIDGNPAHTWFSGEHCG